MTCALCVPLLCATLYVVDGDTVHCDGEKIRLLDFDTPETRRAKCESERVAGYEAKARLSALLKSGPSGSNLRKAEGRIKFFTVAGFLILCLK